MSAAHPAQSYACRRPGQGDERMPHVPGKQELPPEYLSTPHLSTLPTCPSAQARGPFLIPGNSRHPHLPVSRIDQCRAEHIGAWRHGLDRLAHIVQAEVQRYILQLLADRCQQAVQLAKGRQAAGGGASHGQAASQPGGLRTAWQTLPDTERTCSSWPFVKCNKQPGSHLSLSRLTWASRPATQAGSCRGSAQ